MKFRLTLLATALSMLAMTPVYAGGAGGCDYGGRYQSTSVEPQEQSEAARKLASLSMPASGQDQAAQMAEKSGAPGNDETATR